MSTLSSYFGKHRNIIYKFCLENEQTSFNYSMYQYTRLVHIELIFMSGFEKRGHFGPDLNFDILIYTEIIGNLLSFTACFMFVAAWIHICERI